MFFVVWRAANAEEESDDDTQDVLGAVTEGAEVVGATTTLKMSWVLF